MSESSANTRTLILSLVCAMAVLVPLRFYQAGEELAQAEAEYATMAKISEYKTLRLANLNRRAETIALSRSVSEQAVLGIFDENAGPNCISPQNAQDLVNSLMEAIVADKGSEDIFRSQVDQVQKRVCK